MNLAAGRGFAGRLDAVQVGLDPDESIVPPGKFATMLSNLFDDCMKALEA
jgi:hypothetical protein